MKYDIEYKILLILAVITASIPLALATGESISIGAFTVAPGSNVTVPVVVGNANLVAGGFVNVTFNPEIVKVADGSIGTIGTQIIPNIDNTAGFVRIAVSGSTAVGTTSATLVNIIFRGVSNGISSLTVQPYPASYLSTAGGTLINPTTASGSINVTGAATGTDTVGIYRNGSYYLRNSNSAGSADLSFIYGIDGDTPLVGDWNGDGIDTVGIYRHGSFYLKNSNSAGSADLSFIYGVDGDIPLVGDWNGDGTDTVGIYRHGAYYLRNSNSAGSADLSFIYGVDGDTPLVGDWNNDGTDTVGIYRHGSYYLRNSNNAGSADLSFIYGIDGDTPLVGDWNADGTDTVAIYRHGAFYLRNSNNAGSADLSFIYGIDSDTPLVGDWDGS